jgi:hypothetical protein
VRLLRASIAGEASARGERARELGRQARDRINVDFNVDNPDTPPRASQKLIAAATLLRTMPACDAPGFQLPSLTLMTGLAGQMVNPRSTWALTYENSLTHP